MSVQVVSTHKELHNPESPTPAGPSAAPTPPARPLNAFMHVTGALGKPTPTVQPAPSDATSTQPTLETRTDPATQSPTTPPAPSGPARPDAAAEKTIETPVETPEAKPEEATSPADKVTEETVNPSAKPEEEAWFFIDENTRYKTPEDAKKGIRNTQLFVKQLRAELEATRQKLAEAEPTLQLYSNHLPKEKVREIAVQELLPDQFRGKNEDDFVDESELKEFVKAVARAEAQYEQTEAEAQKRKEAEAARKAEDERLQAERAEKAATWLRDTATSEFFETKTPEEYERVFTQLATPDEQGFTTLDQARMIAEVFGEKAATLFLSGVKRELRGKQKEEVVQVIQRTQTIPTPPVVPPAYPSVTLSPQQHVTGALKTQRR